MRITTKKVELAAAEAKSAISKMVSPKKLNLPKKHAREVRKLTLVMIFASVVLVLGALFLMYYFEPERTANRELERMAKEYYEDYLYERFIENSDLGTEESLAEFSEGGLDRVRLRQLLLYNGGANSWARKYFEGKYRCDLDATEVIYHPASPFGVKDYTVEYKPSCKKM